MTDLYYRNPRLLILTVGLILVVGASSFYLLPRMEDPLLTERAANVNTLYPGADAARVESLVTEKLEEELREVEEIKELRSRSRAGISTISIELRDEVTEVGNVWSRIRDKLDDAAVELPPGAGEPEFDQVDMKAYALIVAVQWKSDGEPNYAILRRLAEQLEDRLKAVAGTEEVETFGDPDEEILVEIRPAELASLGLTAADVARQVEASDAKVAAGQLRGPRGDLLLEVDGELDTLARIGRTPIRHGAEGRFVQLADIGTVAKGIADPPGSLALIDGQRAVALGVLVRSQERIDHWSASAHQALADFEAQLPRGVGLEVVFEQNGYVQTRLNNLLVNLLIGGLAVMAVIFVMMGWRSALIVGTTLPLAALMVLSGLRLLDIPIHQMSVTGLIIALGLLIDNAIVVVDEVSVKLTEGRSPRESVSGTVRHLAVPLFGSTLTTALAFAPIALMPGPAGEFVGSIAVSVVLAVGSSFFLAMTVVPALTALGWRAAAPSAGEAPRRWWHVGFSHPGLTRVYRALVEGIVRRPWRGIAIGLALPIAGFVVARQLPEQFFPPADRDQIQIELELPPHASLSETLATARGIRETVGAHDEVRHVHWFLGESAPTFYYNLIPRRKNTARYGQALVQLESAEGSRALIHRLQDELNGAYPDARVLVRQLEQGPPFDAPVEVRLFGPDVERLRALGDEMRAALAATPEVIHTRAELSEALPKLSVALDEEQTRLAGLDHAAVARQLNATLEGAVGGTVLEATEELPVRVRVSGADRAALQRIASLDVLPATARFEADEQYQGVPLEALGDIRLQPEVAVIPHFNGQRMNEVQAFITAGALPADVLSAFQRRLAEAGIELLPGYTMEYGGEAAKRDEAIGNLMGSVGVLAVLMVATLVLSFRSFRMAGLVGSVAALAGGLGVGALWLFGYPFGFMAIVGTMGLVGVAINDTIVVLAAIREDRQAREGEPAAVREVVVRSTRHVVATSLTTMAGFAPLVLAGGGFWPPLAVAIAGGVGGATVLALHYIPAAYVLVMCRGCEQRAEQPVGQPATADEPSPAERNRLALAGA